jgi:hypothetical protein
VLEAFQGTLVLDEADLRFSDATADLTKILNNGNMVGLPVLRTMSNRYRELNPQAFRVFGPKLVAMRRSFDDRALESRFLTEETGGRTLRSDIAIQLPDIVGADSTGSWARFPRDGGHGFHGIVGAPGEGMMEPRPTV